MASGKRHAAVGTFLLLGGTITAHAVRESLGLPASAAWQVGAGLLVGLLITPDIDQAQTTHEEARLRSIPIVGNLVRGVWEALWYPYAKAVPHRADFSHAPLLGTAARMVYLCLLCAVARLAWAYISPVHGLPPYPQEAWQWWTWWLWPWTGSALVFVYLGWALQDTQHWILDWSIWKAFRKPKAR